MSLQKKINCLVNYQGWPSQLTLIHMAVSKQENKVCDRAGFHQLPLQNNQLLSGFFSVYIARNMRFVWFVWGE